MKNIIVCVAVTALTMLVGCRASVTEVKGPDGERAYSIDCGSNVVFAAGQAKCLEAAGEVCGRRGYVVLHEDEGAEGRTNSGLRIIHSTVLIRCKSETPWSD